MMAHYILKDRKVKEVTLIEWGKWMSEHKGDRTIAYDDLGKESLSTVFLGLDHNFGMEGDPILFETMIFGGEHDGYQKRYCTIEEAEEGHALCLKILRKEL